MEDKIIYSKGHTTEPEALQVAIRGMKALEDYRRAEDITLEIDAAFRILMSLPKSTWLDNWKRDKGMKRFFYLGWWRLKLSRETINQEG